MRKKTHWLVTKTLCQHYKIGRVDRWLLCFGSILPDLTLSYVYKQHSFKKRYLEFKSRESSLFDLPRVKFCLECGRLMHYLGDFFTTPHNKASLMATIKGHHAWERRLAKKFKRQFSYIDSFEFCNLWKDHIKYLRETSSVDVDYNYIVKEISCFFNNIYKRRLVVYA